jgi:hypothetical protein
LQTVHLSTGMRVDDWSDKETDDPVLADDRNFHKVEKWTLDGMKVDGLLYAASPRGHWLTPEIPYSMFWH